MIHTEGAARDLARTIRRGDRGGGVLLIGKEWARLAEILRREGLAASVSEEIPGGTEPLAATVVVNDLLKDIPDIWMFLRRLRKRLAEDGRCIIVHTSWYWQALFDLMMRLKGGRKPELRSWISHMDVVNFLELNGFEVVSHENRLLCPFAVPLVEWFLNRVVVRFPLAGGAAMSRVYYVRQDPAWADGAQSAESPSVSVIVPCRDERGNIRRCVDETPPMGAATEIVFVEGGSKDGTAREIGRVIEEYRGPLRLRLVSQTKADGKGGAVRLGFEAATGEILMILDADLTVPPAELKKFYLAMVEGHGELIMGSRLVYPMEDQAMRTLNILGNKFFSLAFTWLLDRPIKDTLCGTKVLRKRHYELIRDNRDRFGFKDPFGDFDLIFGAAFQNWKIVEIPLRYRARTYGDTKISRFRHGWLLLQMCAVAFRRFKLS